MDGVHVLRKRSSSRLWYRQVPVPPQRSTKPAVAVAEVAAEESDIDDAWEKLFAELEGEASGDHVSTAPVVAPAPVAPPQAPIEETPLNALVKIETLMPSRPTVNTDGDEWRTVPAGAPSLLLSATTLLDARDPGPVLHPGVHYRIAGVQNGVIGLEVVDPHGEEGDSGLGYCSAVDLICIDRRFAGYQSGRLFDPLGQSKSRVNRLTGGLSNATSSLLSAAASGTRLFF